MASKYEQNLREYAAEIKLVAQLKAQDVTPLTLKKKDPQAAFELEYTIGQLDFAGVIPAVDHLAAKIKQKLTKDPRTPKPKLEPPASPAYHQDNFLGTLGLEADAAVLADTKVQLANPERGIDNLHKPYIREKLQLQESRKALQEWIKFLRDVGARKTPAERRAILMNNASQEVAFLRAIGVWDMIERDGVTPQIIEIIRKKYEERRSFRTDHQSTEAITIYGTPVAQEFKKLLDQWAV